MFNLQLFSYRVVNNPYTINPVSKNCNTKADISQSGPIYTPGSSGWLGMIHGHTGEQTMTVNIPASCEVTVTTEVVENNGNTTTNPTKIQLDINQYPQPQQITVKCTLQTSMEVGMYITNIAFLGQLIFGCMELAGYSNIKTSRFKIDW